MKDDEQRRFVALRQPWCGAWLIRELYGLDVETDRHLLGIFRAWAARFRGGRPVEQHDVQSGLQLDRHELETFFQLNGVLPRKWAAIELAISEEILDKTLDALIGDSLPVQRASAISDQLIEEKTIRGLYKLFPDLRHKVFSSHSSMCAALHQAVRSEYNIEVEPLYCVTSQLLDREKPDYAVTFDAITLEPVGLRYQVWLDFGKPVNLAPDCCSLKFFAQEQRVLEPFVFRGSEPESIPPELLRTGS